MNEPTTTIVRDEAALSALEAQLMAATLPIGFDTEADCKEIVWKGKKRPDPYSAKLVGFSMSLGDECWYVPVAHAEGGNAPESAVRVTLRWLLDAAERRTVVIHNAKFDLQVIKNFGVSIPVFSDHLNDSMVAAWLVGWGADHKALKLKKLAERLGFGASDTFEEMAQKRLPSTIPTSELAPYAGRDAWLAVKVLARAWERMEQYDLVQHFREFDMPLVEIIRGMEEAGSAVNRDELTDLRGSLSREAEDLRKRFYELTEWIVDVPVKRRVQVTDDAGAPVFFKNGNPKLKTVEVPEPQLRGANVSNDHDVARWCYEELAVWPTKGLSVNGAGHYPVDKETIEPFCALPGLAGELARIRLEHGKRTKLVSTYVDPMLGLPPQYADGRLHTTYNLTGTETQRFSSAGPNLQNLPSRSAEGKRIRKALVADEGWEIQVHDYSQIELRICAHLSQDEEMMACYILGEDIHAGTLANMQREWAGATRTDAKITNFSTIYRISPPSLAVKMRTTEDKAEASIEAFYARFPRVGVYHRQAIAYAAKHGYCRTVDGFKRFLDVTPKYNRRSRKMEMSWGVQNEAINTPIQGSSGGIAKRAMILLHKRWVSKGVYGVKARIVGNEHDSLITTSRKDFADEAFVDVKECMEAAWTLRVPLIAEGGRGGSWAEAKE